jgi:hypothetical protein
MSQGSGNPLCRDGRTSGSNLWAASIAHGMWTGIGSPAELDRLIPYLLEVTRLATGACFRGVGGRFLGVDS